MTDTVGNSWLDLFSGASDQAAGAATDFRLLKKSGTPFMALPAHNALAVEALALYPAQTRFARLAKGGLRAALMAGLPVPLQRVGLSARSDDEFAGFLASLVGSGGTVIPPVAVLMGNPHAKGRRFTIMVFGPDAKPTAIVKAGTDEAARELIDQEEQLLKAVGGQFASVPRLRSSFRSDRVRALALDCYAGRSPRPSEHNQFAAILEAWINRQAQIQIKETPAWNRLSQKCARDPFFTVLQGRIADRSVHPVLYHGDFAPWNIKVSPRDGSWTILDWERGELIGIPGWDWFHYDLQTAILVQKLRKTRLLKIADDLLGSEAFQHYARETGIGDMARDLLVAYVLYCVEVLRPTEGPDVAGELLAMLHRA